MNDEWLVVVLVDVVPEIPLPYIGWFERWTSVRTGDVHTVLNVCVMVRDHGTAFFRTFHGAMTHDCESEFCYYLDGEYCSEVWM